ncbi:Fasciclin-like arabinogalactan protein 3 [Sesamum alatum]|uniref:Fasciclin-like arabinogalactan protein 3 n=1 Tax=Sesamum alatum TaxID=300844 RepID=A0AAE1YSK7_9LAMI|nr:Fasciclin-like arabinogalactan protein 3 [Sesamum alatum]
MSHSSGFSSTTTTAAFILISAVLLLSSTTTSAFNVTLILEKYPDYTEFNNLLSRTGVADEINRRQTITVLALSNGRLGEISGKTEDVQKRILSNHVVLDYFDVAKLKANKETESPLTTLFQSSGQAKQQQGFLNVVVKDGEVVLGSAVKGAPMDSKVESSVASQPYNISILSISRPIIAPGIDGAFSPASATAPNASAPAAEGPAAAESPEVITAAGPEAEGTTPADGGSDPPSPNSAAVNQVASGVLVGLIAAVASSFVAGF